MPDTVPCMIRTPLYTAAYGKYTDLLNDANSNVADTHGETELRNREFIT